MADLIVLPLGLLAGVVGWVLLCGVLNWVETGYFRGAPRG